LGVDEGCDGESLMETGEQGFAGNGVFHRFVWEQIIEMVPNRVVVGSFDGLMSALFEKASHGL
jgi:hypothetical protein